MKSLSEYNSEELREYHEEKNALDRMEEEKLERAIEENEREYGDEYLDLEDE